MCKILLNITKKWKFKIKINLFELKIKLSRTQNKVDLQKRK